MNMWSWLVCALLVMTSNSSPSCGVTRELEERMLENIKENHQHGRHLALSRGSTLAPIRFYFHYSLDSQMTQAQEDELKNVLMPSVNGYFTKVIKVYPLLQNIVLSGFTTCSDFTVPAEHKTTGVVGDILVYVTAYSANENTVAWASSCSLEAQPANNILAGRININMYNFGSTMTTGTKVAVLIHEMTHLLGFSNSLFQYFHKPNGAAYTTDERTAVITIRGKQATILKLPTVVSKAKAAYGCSTLEGLELEDQGGSGTAGSHWEKMLMYGDFMMGDTGTDDWVFSDITFAVLEDSGWYSIDYSQTDSISWGKNAGCSFFTNKCVNNGVASSSFFCADTNKSCSKNRLDKGYCTLSTYSSSIPSKYSYFTDPTKGGDETMDFCPIVTSYSNGDCRNYGSTSTLVTTLRGEQACINCRCFDSSLLDSGYVQNGTYQICYKVRCDSATSKYYITVGTTEKECIQNSILTFTGYGGSITCASYDLICTNTPCINYCLKRGQCVNGSCLCDIGYGGEYCHIKCDVSCKNCSGTANNQCTTCRDGESLSVTKTCTCQSGGTRNASTGVCESTCNNLCKTCSTTCSECITNAQAVANSNYNCECKAGFSVSNGLCVASCLGLCATCDVNNGSTCLSCKTNSTLSNSACACNAGFSVSNGVCVANCLGLCATCDGNSGSTCLSCKANSTLSNSACACNAGFSVSNGVCLANCLGLCATCDGNSGSTCLSCRANSTLSNSACACNAGFSVSNGVCVANCLGLCATCSPDSGSTCLSCKANSTLSNSACACNTGFLYDSATSSCKAECNNLCTTCNNSTGCTTCVSNSAVSNSSINPSLCACNAGFEQSSNKCIAICSNICLTCSITNGATCLTCKPNATLPIGSTQGACSCNSGYLLNSSTGNCEVTCNNLCKTCSGTCSECKANAIAVTGSNYNCECNAGFSVSNGVCLADCLGLCATCSPDSGSTCLSCKANSILNSGVCTCKAGFVYDSATSSCKAECNNLCTTCNNSTGCTTCVSNSAVANSQANPSLCACLTGYIQSVNECVAVCHKSCLTCSKTDGSVCLTCKLNASLPSGKSSGSCTCSTGYVMNSTTGVCETWRCPTECTDCAKGSHTCTTCSSGNFYWPEVEGCYSRCPSGFTATNSQCTSNSASVFDFSISKNTNLYTSGTYTLIGSSVKPTYKRGWYFSSTSSAAISGEVLLGPNHYISVWIRPDVSATTRTILSKYAEKADYKLTLNTANLLQLTLNKESYDDTFSSTSETLDLGILTPSSWSNIVLVFSFSKPNTTIAYYNNSILQSTLTLQSAFFKDYTGSSVKYFTVGAHYNGGVYSERFIGFISGFTVGNTNSYTPTTISNCVNSSFCLISCNFNQYFSNTCAACQDSCTDGCIRGTDCRLNEDMLCENFSDYTGCNTCASLATVLSEKCSCVDNASLTSSNKCACLSGYQESNGKCVNCKNYFKSSEVTAKFSTDFLRINVTFAKSVVRFSTFDCSTFINADSLAKLGKSPSCTWNNLLTTLTITLGESFTISREALYLNELVLLASGTGCSYNSETLAPIIQVTGSIPTPTVSISGSTKFSQACEETQLTYSATTTGGLGKALKYDWVFKESVPNELYIYLRYKDTSSVWFLSSYLSAGEYTLTLTVTNYLSKSASTEIKIEVSEEKSYSVVIDAGNTVIMNSADKRRFLASVKSFCGSTEQFNISWSFESSTNPNYDATSVLSASKLSHILVIDKNALKGGFTYTFNAVALDSSGQTGTATMVITATLSELIAQLNKSDGKISSSQALNLSARSSYDPSNTSADLQFKWSCISGAAKCLANDGSDLFKIETNSELSISSSMLKAGSTYTITVTVSVSDGRTASKSVSLEVIEAPSCSISLPDLKSKYNPQAPLSLKVTVSCPKDTTYKFTQESGTTVKFSSPRSIAALNIPSNQMQEGESISFLFTATYENSVIGTSLLPWKVNIGPRNGSVTVSPTTGISFKTIFTISAQGYEDGDAEDYPLKYTFVIKTNNGITYLVSSSSQASNMSFYFSRSVISAGVRICDSMQTCRTVEYPVAVSALRMLDDTSILDQYLDLTRDPEMIPAYTVLYSEEQLDYPTYSTIKSTFVDYIMNQGDFTYDSRSLAYGIFVNFLSQADILTESDIIEILGYIIDIITSAEDSISDEEVEDLMDQVVPIVFSFSLNSDYITKITELIQEALIESRQDSSPILYNGAKITDRSYYIGRIQSSDIDNSSITIEDTRISFSEDLLDEDVVVDLTILIYETFNEVLPVVQVSMVESGSVEDSNFLYLGDKNDIYSLNSDNYISINIPKAEESTIDTSLALACAVQQGEDMDYQDGLCTASFSNSGDSINIESGSTGLFKLTAYVPSEEPDPTEEEENTDAGNQEDCERNLGPAIVLIITSGVYVMVFLVFTFIQKSSERVQNQMSADNNLGEKANEPIFKNTAFSPVNKPEATEVKEYQMSIPPYFQHVNIPEITEVKEHQLASPPYYQREELEVTNNKVKDLNAYPSAPNTPGTASAIQIKPQTFLSMFIDRQIVIRILKAEYLYERRYLLFTILTTLLLEYALLGAFYAAFKDPHDESEIYTGSEVVQNYSGSDFGYVLLALAVSYPVSCLLQYTVDFKHELFIGRGYFFGLAVLGGSLGGCIYMIMEYCHKYAGLWTMGNIILIALEIVIGQNFTALMSSVGAKIKNKYLY